MGCASSLRFSGFVGSSFPPAPPQSSVPSVPPQPSGSTSGTHHHGSALPSWSSGVAWCLCPSDSAWISTFPGFTSVGWAHDSTLAPLSISSTMGHPPPGPYWGRPMVSFSNYFSMDSSTLNSPMDPPPEFCLRHQEAPNGEWCKCNMRF